jgi:hypothetical protein
MYFFMCDVDPMKIFSFRFKHGCGKCFICMCLLLDGHYSTSHLDQLRLKCSTHTKVEIKVEIFNTGYS